MKLLPSILSHALVLLLFSSSAMSFEKLYSIDADIAAGKVFAEKVFTTWNRKCDVLTERIVSHEPDEKFDFTSKRSNDVIDKFEASGHRAHLTNFLTTMQAMRLGEQAQIEELINSKMAAERNKIAASFASFSTHCRASFVGAEWIVVTPGLVSRINEVTQAHAHELLRPEKFGYRLRKLATKTRQEIVRICRTHEQSVRCQFELDVEKLPKTWQEFSAVRKELRENAELSVRVAVTRCQADIDKVIFASGKNQHLPETIALRVEGERNHSSTLYPQLESALADARTNLKSAFIADLKNQSASVAKKVNLEAFSLENLTASYRANLDFLEHKFRSINELKETHEHDLQRLARKDFAASTQELFERNKRRFNVGITGVMKERMRAHLKISFDNLHKIQQQELMAMPITSSEEFLSFNAAVELLRSQAQGARDLSLETLAKGGFTIPNWDLRLIELNHEVQALVKREISSLKRLDPLALSAQQQRIIFALAQQLGEQSRAASTEFDKLFHRLVRELTAQSIDQFGRIVMEYIGDDIAPSLVVYASSESRFSKLFSSTLRVLDASSSVAYCLKTSLQLRKFQTSVLQLFPGDNLAKVLDDVGVGLSENKKLAETYLDDTSVGRKIHKNEAEFLPPLIDAMIEHANKMTELDGSTFSGTLEAILSVTSFVFYVDRVHHGIATDPIKQFLLRLLRSEDIVIRFSAQKMYRILLRELSKSTKYKTTTAFETKVDSVEGGEETDFKDNNGFCGIANMGNTCFASACIQALARFGVWSRGAQHMELSSKEDATPAVAAFRRLTQTVVDMVQNGDAAGIKDKLVPFFDSVYEVLPNFHLKPRGQQRDAQEFLSDVLNVLGVHEESSELPIKFTSSALIKRKVDDATGEYTDVVHTHDIHLPLPGKKTRIKAALASWLEPNSFNRNGTLEPMFTQPLFHEPPEIMIVGINRFNSANIKLKTPISISNVTIPFYQHGNPAGLSVEEKVTYRLVGGIYHIGETTDSGHYYFIDHVSGIVFDDSATYKLSRLDDKAIQKQSYILFFQRVAR